MKLLLSLAPIALTLGLMTAGASGQVIVPSFNDYSSVLGGTDADYTWDGYNSANPPAGLQPSVSGVSSQWPQGIAPNSGVSGITFSGNSNFGSDYTDFLSASEGGGIYSFFTQTHFQINSTIPLSNLESLTMQIYLAEGTTGAMGGTSADLAAAPTLTLITTAGTFTVNPNYYSLSSQTSATVGGAPDNLDVLNYQWNLSGIAGTPESYTLNWQTSYNSITYGEDVTESSTVTSSDILVQAVPEPSTTAALMGGLGVLLVLRRRSGPARGQL